jgi:hypothetical protein
MCVYLHARHACMRRHVHVGMLIQLACQCLYMCCLVCLFLFLCFFMCLPSCCFPSLYVLVCLFLTRVCLHASGTWPTRTDNGTDNLIWLDLHQGCFICIKSRKGSWGIEKGLFTFTLLLNMRLNKYCDRDHVHDGDRDRDRSMRSVRSMRGYLYSACVAKINIP